MRNLLFLFLSLFSFSMINAQTNTENTCAGVTINLPLINNAGFYRYNTDGTGANDNQTGYFGSGFSFYFKNGSNKFSLGYENPSLNKSLFPPKGGNHNLSVNIFEATVTHKVFSGIALIGGINYSNYRYRLFTDIPTFPKVDKKDETLGITTGVEFVPAKSLSVAVTYRPSIFSFDKKTYRAVFSVGLRYDINFWNKKSR
ncbi:MAG: hypothetical protein ABI366_03535 [Ginsengibacter sp.]